MITARTDPGWLNSRIGHLTGSNTWRAMDFKKNGDPTEVRNTYLREVVAERITGIAVSHFVTAAMQHGIDFQADAISEFENETGLICGPETSFVHPDIEFFSATPDATIGDDAVLEVKAPTTSTHLKYYETKEIPTEYQHQIAAQLLCSVRSHGVFCSYDPRLPLKARLIVIDFTPTPDFLGSVRDGAIRFLEEAEELFIKVTEC